MSQLYQANVEFKRIQTFLFSIPKLKEMLGANALLGETLRDTLPKMVKQHQDGLTMPPANVQDTSAYQDQKYRVLRDNDPLKDSHYTDDPIEDWKKGIIAKDGGHFIAVFPTQKQAQAFKEEARNKLRTNLPGLRFDITISTFPEGIAVKDGTTTDDIREVFPEHLSIFESCELAPNALALKFDKQTKKFLSRKSIEFRISGQRFKLGKTKELINILNNAGKLGEKKWTFADEFKQLAGNDQLDQLAIIHADGNGIGAGFTKWKDSNPFDKKDALHELYNQLYFHKMRVAVRVALSTAITKTFGHVEDKVAPFQIMMLGGDDLLFVCQASYALEFVTEYAKALEADGVLTIGAGVAIMPHSFPFYRGHALAEELAGSAKKKVRALASPKNEKPEKTSVIDWMHITQAWSLDPEEARQEDSYVRYKVGQDTVELALSCRPYTAEKLSELLKRADKLEKEVSNGTIARSALRDMVLQLPRGKRQAEIFYEEKLIGKLKDDLWVKIGDQHQYTTDFADLVEIVELRLKRPKAENQNEKQGEPT